MLTGRREIVVGGRQWEAEPGFLPLRHVTSVTACASDEELRALRKRYRVGDDALNGATPAYSSPVHDRPNGVVVTGRDTRNAYARMERSLLPEEPHEHADQEKEALYVISGELTVEVDGVALSAPERSFVVVPRGLRHRHLAASGSRLLTIYSQGHAIPQSFAATGQGVP